MYPVIAEVSTLTCRVRVTMVVRAKQKALGLLLPIKTVRFLEGQRVLFQCQALRDAGVMIPITCSTCLFALKRKSMMPRM